MGQIAIITYDAPHRKTQDLLSRLKMYGYHDITLIATPWIQRKVFQPIYSHRPSNSVPLPLENIAFNLEISLVKLNIEEINGYLEKHPFEFILIGGAGLLPNDLVETHRIINAHPGFLPEVRGLDALKWAIYEGKPIGVTTHYVDAKADEGLSIERRRLIPKPDDTFHTFAYRLYETEIEMMVNALTLVARQKEEGLDLSIGDAIAHRRMPPEIEEHLLSSFESLKQRI